MSTCSSLSISDCKQIKAFIECIPTLIQGENRDVNIQLLNEDNTYMDTNFIEEISLILYDERKEVVGEYKWPFDSMYRDINILQEEYTDEILNTGLISINLDSEVTLNSISGGLYSEIKISSNIDTFGSDDKYISCLVLGKIKTSMINRFNTLSELNNPDNWEENRVR